ncbi:alpha/beta hydrolase [Glycomyces halotolerans]
MSIGFRSLRDADFDALASVADRWSRLAAHLTDQVETLEATLHRRLSDEHWDGGAPEDARARIKAAIAELEARVDPAERAAAAIADAATAFKRCQAELAELVDEGLDLEEPSEAVEVRLAPILERAAEIDDELAGRIALVAETAIEARLMPAEADPAGDLTEMLASGASPRAVNAWWESLSGTEQDLLIEGRPDLIGCTDGIPSEARDEANRRRLSAQLRNLDAEISRIGEQVSSAERYGRDEAAASLLERLRRLRETREDLATLEDRIDRSDRITGQDHYLLGYDAAEDGELIVALGNPDTADNTAVLVPGTGAGLGKAGDLGRAATMAHDAHEAAPREDTSVVMWLGYDAPDHPVLDSPSLSYAKNASGDLSAFMAGLDAANRDPAHATTTVVGHSYGTTVIGQSAKEHGLATDQIIAVASPGMNVADAAELGIDPDHVWASTAPGDVIRLPAAVDVPLPNGDHLGLGPSPADPDFGGHTFGSDPMSWNPLDIHGNYWDEGNAARDNMAFILTGQTGRVR